MLPKVTVFLCTFLCICYSLGATVDIKYVCSTTKEITLDAAQNITQLRVLKDGNSCILTKRILNECGVQPGEPVTLILQDDHNEKVIGGRNSHKVELICSDEGVYTATISPHQWSVQVPTTKISLTAMTPHGITLTLKDNQDNEIVKAVEIGQQLKLSFVIPGDKYILSPKECTARTKAGGEHYIIWQETEDCKHDDSIISKQWISTDQRTLSITMFGFYFPSSTHVTIECKTHVCLNKHTGVCTQTCISNSRRRREAGKPKNETFSYVKSAEVSFEVAVHEAGVNSAKGILPRKQVFGLIAITVVAVMHII